MSGGPSTSTTHLDDSVHGWGISPSRVPAHRQHLRRMIMRGRVAQHAAQPAVAVSDRDDHAPALPPAPELEQRRARPHARLLRPQHARRPDQRRQPLHAPPPAPARRIASSDSARPRVRRPIVAAARRRDGEADLDAPARCARPARRVARPCATINSIASRGGGRTRAPRHTPRPPRRTPSNATRPTRRSPSRTGRGRRARAHPDPRSTPPAPPASPTPAARPPARGRSRAHPRQATCRSRRPLRVDIRRSRRSSRHRPRDLTARARLTAAEAPAHDRPGRVAPSVTG